MSLKRKASFSALTPIDMIPVVAGPSRIVEDPPKHLNSRTRKRFRNDRPDEKVVYENTLRWLFNAQRHHHGPAPPVVQSEDEDEEMESEPLPPLEITDPRQQTLHKFFQPSQSSFSHHRPNNTKRQPNHTSQPRDIFLHSCNHNMLSPATSAQSDADSSRSQNTSADVDMEIESGSDDSAQESKGWVGGSAWI